MSRLRSAIAILTAAAIAAACTTPTAPIHSDCSGGVTNGSQTC